MGGGRGDDKPAPSFDEISVPIPAPPFLTLILTMISLTNTAEVDNAAKLAKVFTTHLLIFKHHKHPEQNAHSEKAEAVCQRN